MSSRVSGKDQDPHGTGLTSESSLATYVNEDTHWTTSVQPSRDRSRIGTAFLEKKLQRFVKYLHPPKRWEKTFKMPPPFPRKLPNLLDSLNVPYCLLVFGVLFGLFVLCGFLMSFYSYYNASAIVPQTDMDKTVRENVPYISCFKGLWANECGIDGVLCKPFTTQVTRVVRCPESCDLRTSNAHVVGGDAGIFRADSSICQAAIVANVIGTGGGCVAITNTGPKNNFLLASKDIPSNVNDLTGNGRLKTYQISRKAMSLVNLEGWFPKSFHLAPCEEPKNFGNLQMGLLAVTFAFLTALHYFNTIHPIVSYFLLTISGYIYVAFFLDKGFPNHFIENWFATCIPFALILVLGWILGGHRSYPSHAHLFEFIFLVQVPFWALIHLNHFAYFLPDVDITSGPGSSTGNNERYPTWAKALMLTFYAIFSIAVLAVQGYTVFVSKKLPKYLAGYITVFATIMIVFAIVHKAFYIHFHHYFFALALLPVTYHENLVSVFLHALCLGLFTNGASSWGFDSILEAKSPIGSSHQVSDFYYGIQNLDPQDNLQSILRVAKYIDPRDKQRVRIENLFNLDLSWNPPIERSPEDPLTGPRDATTENNFREGGLHYIRGEILYKVSINSVDVYIGTNTEFTAKYLLKDSEYHVCLSTIIDAQAGPCSYLHIQ